MIFIRRVSTWKFREILNFEDIHTNVKLSFAIAKPKYSQLVQFHGGWWHDSLRGQVASNRGHAYQTLILVLKMLI